VQDFKVGLTIVNEILHGVGNKVYWVSLQVGGPNVLISNQFFFCASILVIIENQPKDRKNKAIEIFIQKYFIPK